MIQTGDKLPTVSLSLTDGESVNSTDFFAGKKVVLFALPGAFTPTCSAAHLPGYVVLADQIKEQGVDEIACLSVNDSFVMKAWGESQNAEHLTMIADGNAEFTRAIGLDMNTGSFGGVRSQRYAMIVEDGVVTLLNVEAAKSFDVSNAETILEALKN
ncbi:peroxiredoxin [Endozoicomonas sp. OPT23]|uniref:peroxiredoxin n=1 Tax=Endozoicomonas sp. OPT23 TaxID=2072845 RepID=UPI00129B9C5A|nr:peroxiredoxin [Endozoicomonas sp. OPT23]MRI34659.1 peroxiredoxin [Endozoicomonas sp. OPT23]